MSVIAWTAWDSGNFFNADNISNGLKTFITIWPIWGFYRGWGEYKEFAGQAARLGTSGLQWSDISGDPRCGMGTVLAVLVIEWPIFLLFALYLDQVFKNTFTKSLLRFCVFSDILQVLDSGHRVPRHPLFFLNYKHAQV